MTPQNLLIVAVWLAGIWMLKAAPSIMSWKVQDADAQSKPAGHSQSVKDKSAGSSAMVLAKFAAACVATLAAGVALEESGDALAGHFGMSGVLFGATVLAASTSIPELSTGITSIRMGDDRLAISDIFGGNAFLPVLFLLASLLSGDSVLPHAEHGCLFGGTWHRFDRDLHLRADPAANQTVCTRGHRFLAGAAYVCSRHGRPHLRQKQQMNSDAAGCSTPVG